MNIRNIIKKSVIAYLLEQEQPGEEPEQDFIVKLDDIKKRLDLDLKDSESEYKAKEQMKGKLTANNPDRKGLERELPELKKQIEKKKTDVQDLENSKGELEKLNIEKDKLKASQSISAVEKTPSVLPSLNSGI